MRLINTATLKSEDFQQDRVPEYAILSHTWSEEEVQFAEFSNAKLRTRMKGWKKIENCCKQAAVAAIPYVWIDTCCIDKSSSAELSEAINSMFLWYKKATVCYAYLSDVLSVDLAERRVLKGTEGSGEIVPFGKSRWFTRGWTLQELLAPSIVNFFNRNWEFLGTKETLKMKITAATGIRAEILTGSVGIESASAGQRMSWASSRKTSRTEDIAYCLMGLFDVNMPMLYGEGEKAFLRLQEEIIKISDDQSLFAWADPEEESHRPRGLLATHPSHFKYSGQFVTRGEFDDENIPISSTGKGVWINTFVHRVSDDQAVAILNCTEKDQANRFAALKLIRFGPNKSHFARINANYVEKMTLGGTSCQIYVPQNPRQLTNSPLKPRYFCLMQPENDIETSLTVFHQQPDCNVRLLDKSTRKVRWAGGLPTKVKLSNTAITSQLLVDTVMAQSISANESKTDLSIGSLGSSVEDPTQYIFSLPHRPLKLSIILLLETQFKYFLIRLGTDERGEIGHEIQQKDVNEEFDSFDAEFKPEKSDYSLFLAKGELYKVVLCKQSLNTLQADEVCVISIRVIKASRSPRQNSQE